MKKSGLLVSLLLLCALLATSVSYTSVLCETEQAECKFSVKDDKAVHENYHTSSCLHQPASVVFHQPIIFNEQAAHQHICGVEFPPPDCLA